MTPGLRMFLSRAEATADRLLDDRDLREGTLAQSEAARLDSGIIEILKRQKLRNRETQKEAIESAIMVARLYDLFEAKEPKTTLPGLPKYQTFNEWAEKRWEDDPELVSFGLDVGQREVYRLKEIGERLVPLIGKPEAAKMPVRSAIALCRYHRSKGTMPEELVEYAKAHLVRETEAHVNNLLSGGHPGNLHLGGKSESLLVVAPRDQMKTIKEQAEMAKIRFGTENLAEVIEGALVEANQVETPADATAATKSNFGDGKSAVVWGWQEAPQEFRDIAPEGKWAMVILYPGNLDESVWNRLQVLGTYTPKTETSEVKLGSTEVQFVS
jgi:hypothetical protein